jgi:hypothetical protein
MKHSIRYIQVNYPTGYGKNIFVIRGMQIREYTYSSFRFARLIEGMTNHNFEYKSSDAQISFTRIYKGA